MNDLGSQPADGGMMMRSIVPGKKLLAENPGVQDGTKTIGELGPVLERFEVGLGERIVIGVVRPAVGFGDSQIGQ